MRSLLPLAASRCKSNFSLHRYAGPVCLIAVQQGEGGVWAWDSFKFLNAYLLRLARMIMMACGKNSQIPDTGINAQPITAKMSKYHPKIAGSA